MPSRYRRARLDADDPRINVRNRYMEAIRAGGTIAEATAYANARPGDTPKFTKSAVVEETAPVVVKHRILPSPGEREQLLPGKVIGDVPVPTVIDPEMESVKRPMAAPAASQAAPAAPPAAAVSTAVETPPAAETPQAKPTIEHMKPPLPAGWDTKDFPWPKLRGLCMAMGLHAPNSRGDAVRLIRGHLGETAKEPEPAL